MNNVISKFLHFHYFFILHSVAQGDVYQVILRIMNSIIFFLTLRLAIGITSNDLFEWKQNSSSIHSLKTKNKKTRGAFTGFILLGLITCIVIVLVKHVSMLGLLLSGFVTKL